jgi:hypothetical protein
MCVKCGISSCGSCDGKGCIPSVTGDLLYNGLDFSCPEHFSFTSGESLNSIIDTLATQVCTTLTNGSPQGPIGDQGPVGNQGPQGVPGGAGIQHEYWVELLSSVTQWPQFPLTDLLASHTITIDGDYQVMTSLLIEQTSLSDGGFYLRAGGVNVQTLLPNNLDSVSSQISTVAINWRGSLVIGDTIELHAYGSGLGEVNYSRGGGFLINRE